MEGFEKVIHNEINKMFLTEDEYKKNVLESNKNRGYEMSPRQHKLLDDTAFKAAGREREGAGDVRNLVRMVNLQNISGNPTVNVSKDVKRAHFNPTQSTMNINPGTMKNDYIAELSHVVQYEKQPKINFLVDAIKQFPFTIPSSLKMIMGESYEEQLEHGSYGEIYDKSYDVSGTTEHMAHSVIEPELKNYIQTGEVSESAPSWLYKSIYGK